MFYERIRRRLFESHLLATAISRQMNFRRRNACFRMDASVIFRRSSVGDSNITADEFSEEGRSAGGGLRNGDLLTLQKCEATILPTASYEPENLSPCGFSSTFWRQKVEKEILIS